MTTFLARSKVRSSTWSPPAQPVETPSVGSAAPCRPIGVLLGQLEHVVAERKGRSPLTRYRVNVTRPFKKPMLRFLLEFARAVRSARNQPASGQVTM